MRGGGEIGIRDRFKIYCLQGHVGSSPTRRTIKLQLVERFPKELVKGLIHSDGCRVTNRVRSPAGARYEYPRYFFTNHSADILGLFVRECELSGVECRPSNRYNISVARLASVAIFDEFIGPKG